MPSYVKCLMGKAEIIMISAWQNIVGKFKLWFHQNSLDLIG